MWVAEGRRQLGEGECNRFRRQPAKSTDAGHSLPCSHVQLFARKFPNITAQPLWRLFKNCNTGLQVRCRGRPCRSTSLYCVRALAACQLLPLHPVQVVSCSRKVTAEAEQWWGAGRRRLAEQQQEQRRGGASSMLGVLASLLLPHAAGQH